MSIQNGYTRRLADFVTKTLFSSLPANVVRDAKRCILDNLGCQLHGHSLVQGKIMTKIVKQIGGEKEATVVGEKEKVPALHAALANGAMAYNMYDDVHKEAYFHPGSVVIPAAIATAEREHTNGKDLILAVTLGYDVACRVSSSVQPSHFLIGWHPMGTINFGAAVAAGKLLDLDEDTMCHAIGLAGTQSSGIIDAGYGWLAHHFWAGKSCYNGVLSALLAGEGFTAGYSVLEGTQGFCRVFSKDPNLDRLTNRLGEEYEISKIDFKWHFCCVDTHTAIDAALHIMQEHSVKLEDIRKITVKTTGTEILPGLPTQQYPETPTAAGLHYRYSLAVSIVDRKCTPEQFTDRKLKDPLVRTLMGKIFVEEEPEFTKLFNSPSRYIPATVIIETKDRNQYEKTVKVCKGDHENPLSDDELKSKFRMLAAYTLTQGQADDIIRMVDKLERIDDVGELTTILRG